MKVNFYLSTNESWGRGSGLCFDPHDPGSSHVFNIIPSIGVWHPVYEDRLVELATAVVPVTPIFFVYWTFWAACTAIFETGTYMERWLPDKDGFVLNTPKPLCNPFGWDLSWRGGMFEIGVAVDK